jgi:16S rRNA (guanine966-N2)-methyltransferase
LTPPPAPGYIAAVRIIGGSLGGRRLRAPRGAATRPTADRVREALFNMLGDVAGARVLDLFAGTGALALEALSRGAASAVLVDDAESAVRCARENAAALGVADRAAVQRGELPRALARVTGAFDLVFLDPPYAAGLAERTLAALPPHLAPGARVVVEHDRRSAPADEIGPLARTGRRRYGDTEVSFYAMKAAP